MRLAANVGLEVPVHGLVYCADGTKTYFVRRFDWVANQKLALEDFAQFAEANRATKYNASMEDVAKTIDKFCTFPAIEKMKLFKLTIFSFLIGNEDMHLKTFSLLTKNHIVGLY